MRCESIQLAEADRYCWAEHSVDSLVCLKGALLARSEPYFTKLGKDDTCIPVTAE